MRANQLQSQLVLEATGQTQVHLPFSVPGGTLQTKRAVQKAHRQEARFMVLFFISLVHLLQHLGSYF